MYSLSPTQVQQLTQENLELKARCADLERLIEAHGLTAELDKSRSDVSLPLIQDLFYQLIEFMLSSHIKSIGYTSSVDKLIFIISFVNSYFMNIENPLFM